MSKECVEHNGSGCVDTTVDSVIKRECERKKKAKEDYKYRKMMKNVKSILASNGYILEGPISLINKSNGRKRRIY